MIEVEVKGFDELLKKFGGEKLGKGIHQGVIKTLEFLESKAIPETPIRTGHLRKGYNVEVFGFEGKLYNNVEYAHFVHDGTRFIQANPFLERVADNNMDRAETIFNRELSETLNFL